jgi:hypothetical protein
MRCTCSVLIRYDSPTRAPHCGAAIGAVSAVISFRRAVFGDRAAVAAEDLALR